MVSADRYRLAVDDYNFTETVWIYKHQKYDVLCSSWTKIDNNWLYSADYNFPYLLEQARLSFPSCTPALSNINALPHLGLLKLILFINFGWVIPGSIIMIVTLAVLHNWGRKVIRLSDLIPQEQVNVCTTANKFFISLGPDLSLWSIKYLFQERLTKASLDYPKNKKQELLTTVLFQHEEYAEPRLLNLIFAYADLVGNERNYLRRVMLWGLQPRNQKLPITLFRNFTPHPNPIYEIHLNITISALHIYIGSKCGKSVRSILPNNLLTGDEMTEMRNQMNDSRITYYNNRLQLNPLQKNLLATLAHQCLLEDLNSRQPKQIFGIFQGRAVKSRFCLHSLPVVDMDYGRIYAYKEKAALKYALRLNHTEACIGNLRKKMDEANYEALLSLTIAPINTVVNDINLPESVQRKIYGTLHASNLCSTNGLFNRFLNKLSTPNQHGVEVYDKKRILKNIVAFADDASYFKPKP